MYNRQHKSLLLSTLLSVSTGFVCTMHLLRRIFSKRPKHNNSNSNKNQIDPILKFPKRDNHGAALSVPIYTFVCSGSG